MPVGSRAARAILACLLLTTLGATRALSAGGGFAVDNAGVDDAGTCKIEAWASFSHRHDFVGAVAPACSVSLGQPVEFGLQYDRLKFDGNWASGLLLKAKTAIIPFPDEARFGIAISGGSAIVLPSGETAAWFINVPVSFRVADPLQINIHLGGLWDRIADERRFTWGVGFEFSISEPFTLIGEVFSITARTTGAQLGLRYTPHEKVDFDIIYGHNLAGEKADWVTLGVNLRF
jgi:hypothetical protein